MDTMRALVPALSLFLCCARTPTPSEALVKALRSDGALVSAAALALASGQPEARNDLTLAHGCVTAGARKECERFLQTLPQERAARTRAFLALGFGEPQLATERLLTSDDSPETRLLLSLELAKYDLGLGTEESLLRARASLAAARALDQGDFAARIALTEGQIFVVADELASAQQTISTMMKGNEPLELDVREGLIRLNERLIMRASDRDRDATDQARRALSEMNRVSPDEAVLAAEQLSSRFPSSNVTWITLGLARLKAGDEPGAVAALERARVTCPLDPEADYQLAKMHERRARHARAVFYLERGIEAAPAWAKGLWELVDVAMLAREPDHAEAALLHLKRLFPNELAVDLGRARMLLERDDGPRALAVLKEAGRDHPADLRPQLALAKAALTLHARAATPEVRTRMQKQAEEALLTARSLDKNNGEVIALATAIKNLEHD
jgi:tetratricopeptide (TPR) repeat protein